MASQPEDLLGGRYQVIHEVGIGGMARVLHARDLNLQREVAVKVLRDDLVQDPAFQARFLQEARAAANLLHPNIVTVYDFGHDPTRYFIVMEYVSGTDLKTYLRRRGRLTVTEAVDLAIQVCAGVGYAHRAGLVHCDLKPQNILITADGRAKITDFGIARALASIQADETADVVWGSPLYMSPEQAMGAPPSPASDVYALGVILFELLTGRLPFDASEAEEVTRMHLGAAPPSPQALNPEVPTSLERIVLKVLAKEPSARYRTADQLARVLTTFVGPSGQIDLSASLAVDDAAEAPLAHTRALTGTDSQIDWLAVVLGLLAFLAVGGLIPLWLLVYLRNAAIR
jgi:serine/threonine protein kinase